MNRADAQIEHGDGVMAAAWPDHRAAPLRGRTCLEYGRLWLYGLACGLWLIGVGRIAAADPSVAGDGAASSIQGDWLVANRDAVIHIYRVGDEFEGRIVWQSHGRIENGHVRDGKVVTARSTSGATRKSQPTNELRLLWGLRYDASDRRWAGGYIYDADNGNTYHCRIRLINPDQLKLRGYIGFSLFGGTTLWSRVAMTTAMHGGLPYVVMHFAGG